MISQSMSAKDIVSRSGLPRAQAARALYVLLLLGLVVDVRSSQRLKRESAVPILWLRKCVAIAPAVVKYHAILARSLAEVPQYRQEAVQQFEKAIELDDWNTSVYFQFAELCEVMRLPLSAIPLYQKILEIDPEHSKARERLLEVESALKERREEEDKKSVSFVSRLFHRKP